MNAFEDQGAMVGPPEDVLGRRQRDSQRQRFEWDAGLLGDLAQRRRLGRLARLDVALREAPVPPVAHQADLVAVEGLTHNDSPRGNLVGAHGPTGHGCTVLRVAVSPIAMIGCFAAPWCSLV